MLLVSNEHEVTVGRGSTKLSTITAVLQYYSITAAHESFIEFDCFEE